MNVTATGDAEVTLEKMSELKNVTVAGAGAVDLTGVGSVNSVDASANAGGVTVDLSGADEAVFKGGTGKDSITVDGSKAAHDLGAGDDTLTFNGALGEKGTVEGGEGTDTISVAAAKLSDLAAEFKNGDITGFEVLSVSDSLSVGIDMANFAGIDHLTLAGVSAAVTVSNMQSGSTLELGTGNYAGVITVGVDGAAAGQDGVLNIELTHGTPPTSAKVTVQDVETINIVSDGEGEKYNMTLTADKATTVKVSGDAELDLTLTGNKIDTIDAVGNSGGVEIVSALNDGATFTGGTGADTVTLGKSNTVFGGEGADTFKVSNTKVNELSEIKDFGVGDTISMGTFSVSLGKALVSVDSNANLANYVELATQVGGVAWFQYAGDTYVVGNDKTVGFDATNDFIVKLSGTDIDLTGASFVAGSMTLSEGA